MELRSKRKIAMAHWQRTHNCGELRESHVGQTIVLNGWVNTKRKYNDQIFVDVRDRYGITQAVIESDAGAELFAIADSLAREWVISVRGKIRARLPGKTNPKLATGAIEVEAAELVVLNRCPTPPFEVTEFPGEEVAGEDLRLQYRYLDLRRPSLQQTLAIRHRMNKAIRDHLDVRGFLELETPLLGRSTPEGARDYLVPSRVHLGQWYALPQSPQLYKQLLMVAGYDRYFQIAHCMRDEDLRADRQPEFTQLDVEMSFVEQDDIFSVVEGLTKEIFLRCLDIDIPIPLPRLSYADAMLRYGSDKPDLRYGLEITDLSDLAGQAEVPFFRAALDSGGKVRALNVKGAAAKLSRRELDGLAEMAKGFKAKGLANLKVEAEKLVGPIEKFLPAPVQLALRERLSAAPGDLLLFVADTEDVVCQTLGTLRTHLAAHLKLFQNWWDRRNAHEAEQDERRKAKKEPLPPFKARADEFQFAWVLDFPSFIWDDEEKRWVANHHPFTAPRDEDLPLMESDPGKVRAKAYDLVLNGYEIAGGSIRIHSPEVQSRLFARLGMTPEQARERFGFLLDALAFGAPPHGGIALGLDRWAMMLAGTTNIRDVIAFPKNQKARDLMTGAPAEVDKKQLKELGL
jgi:aspartyl-tRNA synthetase